MAETATERGSRIEREAGLAHFEPLLREQFDLALSMVVRRERDRAAGAAPMLAYGEAVRAGLDPRIADAVYYFAWENRVSASEAS